MGGVRQRIVVVEDDSEINALVARYLRENDFEVISALDSHDLDAILVRIAVDLIVLDINLPGEDGFSLCVRLRRTSRVPIIMLTAKAEDTDRILGLEIGADDYVCKPFNPRELLARIRAVLRRQQVSDDPPPRSFHFKGWRLDVAERRLRNPLGADVSLTGAEFQLLIFFCEEAGRVLSRDRLFEATQAAAANGRSVDILVSRLRRKIEDDPRDPVLIKTVRSGGYVFAVNTDPGC